MKPRNSFTATETFIPRGKPIAEQLAEHDCKESNYFLDKGYAKVYQLSAGKTLGQHKHKVNHHSALLLGRVVLECMVRDKPVRIELVAPWQGTLMAHTEHRVTAITEALWACLWDNPDGLLDANEIEKRVVA